MDVMVRETRTALKSPLWNILGCDWDAWTRLSGGRDELSYCCCCGGRGEKRGKKE
jgi:hypothetical protein